MRKYRVIRYLAYTIEIVVLFVLQETPGLIPAVGGARPILLIPAVLAVAMFEDRTPALFFGLLSGLLIDFGAGSILGFHGLLLSAACFIVSAVTTDLFQTNFLTSMLVSVITSACVMILQWACFYVLYGYEYPLYALTVHYIPMYLYTAALMPVTYYFNRALALQIHSKEE